MESSSLEESDGSTEKMNVTITIDGSQCEGIGFEADYEMLIDMMDPREVISVPTGRTHVQGPNRRHLSEWK